MPFRSALIAALAALAVVACSAGTTPPGPAIRPTVQLVGKPISLAILEDYDKGHDLALVARDFGLFRELGITTWRGSFGWDDYEPRPGVYDFEWLREFVQLARDSGISLRPYLGYTPEWAAAGRRGDGAIWNDPPRDVGSWTRFVDTLAATLGGYSNVLSWEIYNEENVPLWWDGSAAEYNQVLAAGAARIRARDPDAEVLIGGTVWPDSDWLEAACTTHGNAAAFDIAPFHAYPETWPDTLPLEDYLDENYRRWYLEAVDSACGGKPVWINEAGFATTPGRADEEQARWWARAFAVFFAAPRVEHIGVYEIRDLRTDSDVIGETPNYYLGLVRADGTPKPAFRTIAMLARLFAVDSLTVMDHALEPAAQPGMHRHLFQLSDGRRLLFLWTDAASTARRGNGDSVVTASVTLPAGASRALRYDLDGMSRPLPLAARGRRVTLRIAPEDVAIIELFR